MISNLFFSTNLSLEGRFPILENVAVTTVFFLEIDEIVKLSIHFLDEVANEIHTYIHTYIYSGGKGLFTDFNNLRLRLS